MSLRLFPGLLGRLSAARPQASPIARSVRHFTARSTGPRLDGKQFFTPLRRPTPAAPGAAGSSTAGWKGLGVGGLFKRAFGTTRPTQIIRTQWTQNQRRGSGPGQSWWRRMKYKLDLIPAKNVTIALILMNVCVFLAWQYAISSYQRFGDPSAYYTMLKNFILNVPNMQAGRVWVLITSCFSHQGPAHILFNSIGLYFAGPAVAYVLGTSGFLALYLGAGIFSALTSLWWQNRKRGRTMGSEGASGAIYGCMAFFGAMFPSAKFLLFYVIPVPAWVLLPGVFAWDLWQTLYNPGYMIDGMGHIGGIIAGVATALVTKRRMRTGRWYR